MQNNDHLKETMLNESKLLIVTWIQDCLKLEQGFERDRHLLKMMRLSKPKLIDIFIVESQKR